MALRTGSDTFYLSRNVYYIDSLLDRQDIHVLLNDLLKRWHFNVLLDNIDMFLDNWRLNYWRLHYRCDNMFLDNNRRHPMALSRRWTGNRSHPAITIRTIATVSVATEDHIGSTRLYDLLDSD